MEKQFRAGESVRNLGAGTKGLSLRPTACCAMIDGGSALPVGSARELSARKGYALTSMVDILRLYFAGLTGVSSPRPLLYGKKSPRAAIGKGIGHFFGAIEIDGFIDKDEFKKQIDDWIQVFRNTKPAPGTNGPLIPGDPEREAEAIRSKEGIPLLKPVVGDLLHITSVRTLVE